MSITLSKVKIEWLKGRDEAVKNRLSPKFLIARRDQKKLEAAYNPLSGILSMYINCSPEAFSDDIRNILGVEDVSTLEWRQTNLPIHPVRYETAVIVTASSKA